MTEADGRVREIFRREIERAENDQESTAFVEWLERLRDEIVKVLQPRP